jgi:DedD protein
MDSRAKQRLTGAVILVALFVLLVPELLTGPREADVPAGAAADEGMRRYTIDLDATAPPAQSEISPAQPAVVLPPVADDLAKPGDEAAPAPAMPAPAPTESATVRRTEVPRPPVQMQEGPTQAAPTRAAPQVTPAPAARGSFVVQLGSFRSRENADRLVRDMTAKGFASFVAPITSGGRELYRVRVGPTRDRAAAEALAGQLRRIGQSGAIVPIS